jgi:hypothetical protein
MRQSVPLASGAVQVQDDIFYSSTFHTASELDFP